MPPLPTWTIATHPAYTGESSQGAHHPFATPLPENQSEAPLADESTTDESPSSTLIFMSSSSKTSANLPYPSSLVSSTLSSTLSGEASSSTAELLPVGILPSKKNNATGSLVGGVLGGLAFFILLSAMCYQFRWRRRSGSIPVLVQLKHDPHYTQPSGMNEKPGHTSMAIDNLRNDAEVGSLLSDSISRAQSSFRKGRSTSAEERDVEMELLSQRVVFGDFETTA